MNFTDETVELAKSLYLNKYDFDKKALKWIIDNRDLISSNAQQIADQLSGYLEKPHINVTISNRNTVRRYGTAWKNRIVLYYSNYDKPCVLTLLHELAHCFAPPNSGHDVDWKTTFIKLIKWWNEIGRHTTNSIEDEALNALKAAGISL